MHFRWEVTWTPNRYIFGQSYSHAYVITRETWTHRKQQKHWVSVWGVTWDTLHKAEASLIQWKEAMLRAVDKRGLPTGFGNWILCFSERRGPLRGGQRCSAPGRGCDTHRIIVNHKRNFLWRGKSRLLASRTSAHRSYWLQNCTENYQLFSRGFLPIRTFFFHCSTRSCT